MRRGHHAPRSLVLITTIAAMLLGLLPTAATAGPASPAGTGAVMSDQLLVKLAPWAKASDAVAIARSVGATVHGSIPQLGVTVLKVDAGRSAHALQALTRNPNVAYAEPDAVLELDEVAEVIPNDPYWGHQWSQRQTNTTKAWSITTGSPDVVVAVLDTGLTPVGPEWTGRVLPGHNAFDGSSNVTDTNGHGTRVASVACVNSSNSHGIAAYNWGCRVLPVKVAESTATASSISAGILWAADNGAHIINLSLAGSSGSTTLHNAVKYAAARDVLLIASAGNDGGTAVRYPAAYPEVIGVAGTRSDDTLYSWSNHGSWVDVAAPGSNMSVSTTGDFGPFGGTSSAAPALSGVAALAFSLPGSPNAAQVRDALQDGSVSIGSVVRHGRVDALATLTLLGGSTSTPSTPSAPNVGISAPTAGAMVTGTVTVAGTASSNDTASISRVDVTVGGQTVIASGTTNWSRSIDTSTLPPGTIHITATAHTTSGASASTSVDVTVSHPQPEPEPELKVTTSKVKGRNVADLYWDGAIGSPATVLRDGKAVATVRSGTSYRDDTRTQGQPNITYQVCASTCTTTVTVSSW